MRDDDISGRLGELIRYGTIASVDLAHGKCTVKIGDIVSQPVRWLHGAAGTTGSWSPPSVGEQVLLLAPEGDIMAAVALRGVHSDDHPPVGNAKRELIKYADGAVIAYDPDGHVLDAVLPGGATVNIVAPGGVKMTADVRITGDLHVEGKVTVDKDVTAKGISLADHRHGNVQAGASTTGKPQ